MRGECHARERIEHEQAGVRAGVYDPHRAHWFSRVLVQSYWFMRTFLLVDQSFCYKAEFWKEAIAYCVYLVKLLCPSLNVFLKTS